jgi:hypothetical protein
MRRTVFVFTVGLALGLAARAQDSHFIPGRLAVLRAGDGKCLLILKQSPIFVDQFEPEDSNGTPSFTVRIPTNGPDSFFFNGHAASEGNLTRSSDHKLLTFAGYGGMDLLKVNGTASRLSIPRGFATVDPAGTVHTFLYKSDVPDAKVNPRGVVTDGKDNFWGCGNAYGTFYYNPSAGRQLARFKSFPSSRDVNIINDVLYVSMNAADGALAGESPGIYDFQSEALPREAGAAPSLVVGAASDYTKVVGFDINPAQNIVYMSDTAAGVEKYVKTNDQWTLAYNFAIPQTIPKDLNNAAGCFGLVVDFSQPAPVIYATTTEGYGGCVNSNRVVRIVDTNSSAMVKTIAQAGSTNIAFRGIAFTPD